MTRTLHTPFVRPVLAAALLACSLLPAHAKDYLLTTCRPNLVVVADPDELKVVRSFTLPNSAVGHSPGVIVPSKDGKIGYVLHNRWESVSGIDLDTGKELFRADFSHDNVRGKVLNGMDLSPDGKELAVYVSPMVTLPGEYQVQDNYIAIYDTAAGLSAQPKRILKAPRRITSLMWSTSGKTLYALGWDLYKIDPANGRITGQHPMRAWQRPDFGQVDILNMWAQFEQSNIFTVPYFIPHKDKKTGTETVKAGIWTLNLATDQVRFKEFEDASVVLFSSATNPVRTDEVFTVYTTLTRTNVRTGEFKRIDLDHTFYNVNLSSDGKEVFVGGAQGEIAAYDTETLTKRGSFFLPGKADAVAGSMRVIHR